MREAERLSPVSPISWVDRLEMAILRAPGPWWLPLVAVWLALILAEVILLRVFEGAAPSGPTPVRLMVLYAGVAPYYFGLLMFLDRKAEEAILRLRPRIKAGSDWRVLSASISNMPFWPALLWTAAGLVTFLLLHGLAERPARLILTGTTEATGWIRVFEGMLFWLVAGVGVYHTFRQLRIIDDIYSRHVEISLLDQSPLYGLATVSSYTAVGIFVPPSLIILILPQLSSDPTSLALAIAVVVMALFTFIAPVHRLHQVLEEEKHRRLSANAQSIEELVQRLYGPDDTIVLEHADKIQRSIEAFNLERKLIDSARTWPWPAGAMRSTIAALLLPTVIWIIQRLLQTVFS